MKIQSVCRLLYDLRCSADCGRDDPSPSELGLAPPELTLNRGIAAATPGPKGNGQPHGRRGDLSCQCYASRRAYRETYPPHPSIFQLVVSGSQLLTMTFLFADLKDTTVFLVLRDAGSQTGRVRREHLLSPSERN